MRINLWKHLSGSGFEPELNILQDLSLLVLPLEHVPCCWSKLARSLLIVLHAIWWVYPEFPVCLNLSPFSALWFGQVHFNPNQISSSLWQSANYSSEALDVSIRSHSSAQEPLLPVLSLPSWAQTESGTVYASAIPLLSPSGGRNPCRVHAFLHQQTQATVTCRHCM